jgi:hypothetical protein
MRRSETPGKSERAAAADVDRASAAEGAENLAVRRGDEPSGWETAEAFARTVNRLRGGQTIMFIAHHVPQALIVDREILMSAGH